MSLVTLRETVAKKLGEGLGDLKSVSTHGGAFGLEQLRKYGALAPCAIVGITGIAGLEHEGGDVVANVEWGCYAIAKDQGDAKRDAVALLLAQGLLKVITPSQDWNGEATYAPDSIKARNAYGKPLDDLGIAMWAITWTQKQDLSEFDATTLADFLRYRATATPEHAEHDDTPGIDTHVDLEGASS